MVTDADTDRLLRATGNLGKEAGCYTEIALKKQNQRHCCTLTEERLPQKVNVQLDGIRWASVRHALQQAKCNTRAIACLELSLMGLSYREIAEKKYIAVSPSTVMRDCHCALDVIRADTTLGLLEVICDVFGLSMSVVIAILKNN